MLIHFKPNILSESRKKEKENLLGPVVYHEHAIQQCAELESSFM